MEEDVDQKIIFFALIFAFLTKKIYMLNGSD